MWRGAAAHDDTQCLPAHRPEQKVTPALPETRGKMQSQHKVTWQHVAARGGAGAGRMTHGGEGRCGGHACGVCCSGRGAFLRLARGAAGGQVWRGPGVV